MKFAHVKSLDYRRGLTLVELLISITIIGILAIIIISSLNNSRVRAYDARVKEQLSRFRSSAELYYSNQVPDGYTPAVSLCTLGMFADVDPLNGSPGRYLDFTGINPAVTTVCQSISDAYAIKASLPSGGYFCVDSKGMAKVYSGVIGGTVTQCP